MRLQAEPQQRQGHPGRGRASSGPRPSRAAKPGRASGSSASPSARAARPRCAA
ncbi:hypothetical protein HMPREF0731_4604 [Pseudoroseomonas cervicalis ATCC 49957]|uniref:Uncharacterized protein n=1 Tax=Pseudoroseomonas cervicalis ATCC 49957 TaxID=525371 RepID=D5RU42_9PROT|nr:hypothetical protein HMPREF0731_4604 [Pseudoroseomonas cervicalis ATCC 49957]